MPPALAAWGRFLAKALLYALGAAVLWTLGASLAFLVLEDRLFDPKLAAPARLAAWPLAAWRGGPDEFLSWINFAVAGALPTAALLAVWRRYYRSVGGLRGVAQLMLGVYLITRAPGHTYGAADWAPMERVQKVLPAEPDRKIGGVVLGEAVRMDTTSVADVRFDPEDPETWGPGGAAPLLFERCREGSTHGIAMVGSGQFKTTSFMLTLDHWRTGAFVFDPAMEVAEMTAHWRTAMGHTVRVLTPGGGLGTNVLKWIWKDIDHPLADLYLTVTIDRCYGATPPTPGQSDGNAAFFREQGKNLFTALVAHLLWEPGLPPELKTLRMASRMLRLPQQDLRDLLRHIYLHSRSELARDLAAPFFDLTEVTFGGIVSNATHGTNWLRIKSLADMVSDDHFDLAELCDGKTTVYFQIEQDVAEAMPAVVRAVGSAAIYSVINARGKVEGRVWFWLDEADLWGAMGVLKTVRDRGRKSKISLTLCYQSEGLVEEVWGAGGKKAWFAGVTWLMYGVQRDPDTAKSLSTQLGSYGAQVTNSSSNKGTSGRGLEVGTRSKGSSESTQEVKRDLMMPHELLQDLRTDERIVLYLGERPFRVRASPAFCRPEYAGRIGRTDYQPKAA